jgi:hypothetical protein
MSKVNITVACWEKGHVTEVQISRSQLSKFQAKCDTLKVVCPQCKPENKAITPLSALTTYIAPPKAFRCRHGHLTLLSLFSHGMINVKWGPDSEEFENIEGSADEALQAIADKLITCNHTIEKNGKVRVCGCKLTAVDDTKLEASSSCGFKTKTRVEDVWRRNGVPDPVEGDYDPEKGEQGNPFMPKYNATEFEKRNKERLKNMKRKRNISVDRLPGTPVNQSSNRRSNTKMSPEKAKRLRDVPKQK